MELPSRSSKSDKVEAPIIACNDNLPTSRVRRPSTPNRPRPSSAMSTSSGGGSNSNTLPRKGRDDKKQGSRIRSASAGRDHKSEMASRYWTYLFENLERSISEIYEGCEKEENLRQCKEVILILENYTRDFTKLIEWFYLKWSYEKTPPPMRPQALAWEIRKPKLCLLPHTRAYEKLLGLKESNNTAQQSPLKPIGLENTKNPNSCVKLGVNSPTNSTSLSKSEYALTPLNEPRTVDAFVQADIEEPDVYYFAGGRIVATMTDYTEDYPPLSPICFKTMPAILVLSSDSDMEISATLSSSHYDDNPTTEGGELTTSNESGECVMGGPATIPPTNIEVESNNLVNSGEFPSLTASFFGVRPTTPNPTKCIATQLSAGILITDEAPLEKGAIAGSVKTQNQEGKEKAGTDKNLDNRAIPTPAANSTFAEKAKNGMLRQNQAQSKSLNSNLNKVGTSPNAPIKQQPVSTKERSAAAAAGRSILAPLSSRLRPSTSNLVPSKVAPAPATKRAVVNAPPVPNYRSNIASRCRTAVNSGQTSQGDALTPSTQKSIKDKSNKTSSSQSQMPTASTSPPTSALSKASNSVPDTDTKDFKSNTSENQETGAGRTQSGGESDATNMMSLQGPSSATLRLGITRSKSLINPLPSRKGETRAQANDKTNNSSSGSTNALKSRVQSNSYISLPDESRGKGHIVDADGWETVRAKSNRARWSSSNSSIGSSTVNQSRNSLDKAEHKLVVVSKSVPSSTGSSSQPSVNKTSPTTADSIKPKPAGDGDSKVKKVETKQKNAKDKNDKNRKPEASSDFPQKPTKGRAPLSDQKKDDVMGDSLQQSENDNGDDEEIKKKDADLDDAIRQEELLEEELLQVEKDFERIENDNNAEDSGITDSEHAPSPEVVDNEDLSEMDDQVFFVSIDDSSLANVEYLPPREPGRLLNMREKLMSPMKKPDRDGAETLKKHHAKLAKAERNREMLLQAQLNRYVELSDRFEALNETTKKLVAERADLIIKAEERRKRAAEKREEYLRNIQRKAHDEESKAKEIAFINSLEAQNKRYDFLASAQGIEERLQTMQDERRLKLEERAGKAAAVISRQTVIMTGWQAKLDAMQEKRRKADERITREKEERAKERSEMAQEKARDREERLSALQAAQAAEKEELKKKIKLKQEETARRHEENMEQIRQRAIELGTPRAQEENSAPSTYRVCTLCNIIIQSGIHEYQHVRSRPHLDAVKKAEKAISGRDSPSVHTAGLVEGFGFKFIADVQADKIDPNIQPDRNRNKALKKHSKKLFQKLIDSGVQFEKEYKTDASSTGSLDSNVRNKIRKQLLELDRVTALFTSDKGTAAAAQSMDRLMAELRKIAGKNMQIKDAIVMLNGFEVAFKVLQCSASDLPLRTKIHAVEMLHGFIIGNLSNSLYILRGSGICALMNLCADRWSSLIPDDNRWLSGSPHGVHVQDGLPSDPFIESIYALLFNVLECVPDPFNGIIKKGTFLTQNDILSIKERTFDIIGYIVASGMVDRISFYCSGVRGPVDYQPGVANLLRIFMDFLVLLVYTLQFCWGENPAGCILQKKEPDATQLLAALEASELAGALSMAYSLLLHQGAPSRPRSTDGSPDKSIPIPPGNATIEVVKSCLCLINAMARLDLVALQNVLGTEAVSLQFRHIASQLLWQVVPHRQSQLMRRLLTELIISIGNFTVGNRHNQATIQSGQTPTVLQLLCTMPQEYFTDSKYKHNFIATLLAATQGCPGNREILVQNNVDVKILDDYLASEEGRKNVIIRRMLFVMSTSLLSTTQSNNAKKGKQNKKPKPLEEKNVIHEPASIVNVLTSKSH